LPSANGNHTTNGSGNGSFVSVITGLAENTRYIIRAYATNYAGTSYGDTVSFRTLKSWTQINGFIGIERAGAVGFAIGAKGYLGTGFRTEKSRLYLKDFWEYNPQTNQWTQKADFGGEARSSAVGFAIGTKGYIGTGSGNVVVLKDFWEYNPASNQWSRKADFGGVGRFNSVGFNEFAYCFKACKSFFQLYNLRLSVLKIRINMQL